ncbi:hypothetical protein H4683_002770 [Filibacter limicola]|uniref:Uncharacterized protein n=1 Tax=Sporosarcina limicola TaxID=34101 RepID=A0A927MJ60_9BACL|nr:hypothetical protein [Sporosarcina limicola]
MILNEVITLELIEELIDVFLQGDQSEMPYVLNRQTWGGFFGRAGRADRRA